MKNQFIEIDDDYVTISDEHGEIVHWVAEEWEEDSSVTTAIATAIQLYYAKGPAAVREAIGKPVKKVYSIPVQWSMEGLMEVEAESFESAVAEIYHTQSFPKDTYYVDNSFEIQEHVYSIYQKEEEK